MMALQPFFPSHGWAGEQALPADEPRDLRCGIAVEDAKGQTHLEIVKGMSVIEQTRNDPKFQVNPPLGHRLSFVFCVRSDIVPASFDYKVLSAGYPLTIYTEGSNERIAVLEQVQGQFQYRKLDGPGFTPDIQARLRRRLDAFQDAVQSGR
jgi:hypothetical protein